MEKIRGLLGSQVKTVRHQRDGLAFRHRLSNVLENSEHRRWQFDRVFVGIRSDQERATALVIDLVNPLVEAL